jgi:hypothetical protein
MTISKNARGREAYLVKREALGVGVKSPSPETRYASRFTFHADTNDASRQAEESWI